MSLETLEALRKEFEDWYTNQPMDQIATWHADENRYTRFSLKQTAWKIWCASRSAIQIELSFETIEDLTAVLKVHSLASGDLTVTAQNVHNFAHAIHQYTLHGTLPNADSPGL